MTQRAPEILLGGSWVVRSRENSRIATVITCIRGLIAPHEPAAIVQRAPYVMP